MIKILFFIGILLTPGLAYAGNPSADLSVQVIPSVSRRLNFDQQCYESDFRFSMVHQRENAENVAFHGGAAREIDRGNDAVAIERDLPGPYGNSDEKRPELAVGRSAR